MMRTIIFILIIIGFASLCSAQPYGNEWIVPGQSYVKIPVAQSGLVRVYTDTLDRVGFNLGGVNPNRIQVFRRGVEITRSIFNRQVGIFTPGDYIEFYAARNDGRYDKEYYKKPEYQPNPYKNLHNDTAAYFITFSNNLSISGKAMPAVGSYSPNLANTTSVSRDEIQYFSSNYTPGKGYIELDSRIHHSYFDLGEGFTDGLTNQPVNYTISNLPSPSPTELYATIEVSVSGRNGRPHQTRISIGVNQNATLSLDTLNFIGYGYQISRKQIPMSLVRNGNLFVKITPIGGVGTIFDYISTNYIKLTYSRTLDLANISQVQEFGLKPISGNTSIQAVFSNTNASARFYDITNESNVRLINSIPQGGNNTAINVPSISGDSMKLLYVPTVYSPSTLQISKVSFRFSGITSANYLLIYNRQLTLPAGAYSNPVKAYSEYRASVAGGRYDTLSLDIRQVYDQYNYGDYGPMAIRHLADYLLDNGRLKYINLLGKAITTLYGGGPQDLVPSWGNPSSDVLIVSDLNGSGIAPAVPIGRIAAQRSADLAAYLAKVIEYEASGFTDEWRKRSLLLSGGRTSIELTSFKEYVQKYASVASGPLFGSSVKRLSKASNEIIEFININEQLNAGVQQITIFGHSSNSGADIDIGRPSDPGFNNRGKYPLVMINGCRGGNIFEPTGSLNEEWILTPNKGAIAFMASVDEAFPTLLDQYVSRFFKYQWVDTGYFAKPIGLVQQKLIQDYAANFNSTFDTILCDQFTLHGDPALVLFNTKKADYQLKQGSVFLTNPKVTASMPTIRIGVDVKNLGAAPFDSLVVGINRTLPSGTTILLGPVKVKPIMFHDTLYFDIPRPTQSSVGLNVLEVKLNYYDSIPEISNANNTARLEFYLKQSTVQVLYPEKYAIVSSNVVNLMAQPTDPNSIDRNYYFELDSTNQFNSPIKLSRTVSGRFLAQATVTLPQRNNSIWYWRVRFAENLNAGDTAYDNGTFTYLASSPTGWNQGAFAQLSESVIDVIQRDYVNRKFILPNISVSIAATASGSSINQVDVVYNGLSFINGSGNPCGSLSRTLSMLLNQYTLSPTVIPYTGDVSRPWLYSCGREPVAINFYNNDAVSSLLVTTGGAGATFSPLLDGNNYMGDYVLFLSYNRIDYTKFNGLTRKLFGNIGADTAKMALLRPGEPFIILGKKGSPVGSAIQFFPDRNSPTPPLQQILRLNTTLTSQPPAGTILSSKIGPSSNWSKLQYQFTKQDASDSVYVSVIGVRLNGTDSLLYKGCGNNFDLSSIDARAFPYLFLKAVIIDSVQRTPALLNYWRVLYTGVPEGLVTTAIAGGTTTIADIDEGAPLSIKFGFKNVSQINFGDSMLVNCLVTNQTTGKTKLLVKKFAAVLSGATDTMSFSGLPTNGFVGDNRIDIFVNPQVQSELYYSNNIIQYSYKVKADRAQPILDVVFDGVRIMDGDIVNPSPFIAITLNDNNKYKQKQDTIGLSIILTPPGNNATSERIAFNDPRIQWTAASGNIPFRIEFRPAKLADGKYKLQVAGTDVSGNTSGGGLAYNISFTIINESKLSHFYPYPNPFSTSTRFVFTLTGDKVPDELKIQIMTVSGRVVREITRSELGPIRIGNNITSFAWDGSDEYGDKLANGVYLYKVIARSEGASMEQFNTAADDTFKYGFGKMYIMR